jgi:hypothetical protein
MGSDTSEDGLKRKKDGSLIALREATTRLDTYYAAEAAGGTNDSNILHEVTAIRTAIDDYMNAAENYVGNLEEQVKTYRKRIIEV